MARARKHVERRLADHTPPTPQPTPCRLWQGPDRHGGYGQKYENEPRRVVAIHRWVIEQVGEDQFGTPWDPDLIVMHLCDNPPCYRFDHLRLGTQADNLSDMTDKKRRSGGGQHGERNHQAILTADQVEQIRAEYVPRKVTHKMLAERYGVSPGTIKQVVSGRIWRKPVVGFPVEEDS